MVLFLSVLGFYMIAKWTWIMNHGMTRVYSEGWNFHSGFILACPLDLFWEAFNSWWRLLDACADSGCLCGCGFWQHYVWIYSCNLASPANEPPSFPGTLSEIRVHERHTLVNSLNLERVKWDEMITIMSCCYVSGMSAWVVFGLATLPFLTMRVLQVRFHDDIDGSSLARAIYASTGPLLLPFDSGFPTHTDWHTDRRTDIQTYGHTDIPTYRHTHVHTYPRTHVPTYTRTHVHTYTYSHTHIHTYTRTHRHTHIHTYLHTYIPTYVHTYIRTYVHTYIRTYVHTDIRTYGHTDIRTYVHTYILTYIHSDRQTDYLPTYLPRQTDRPTYLPTHPPTYLPTYRRTDRQTDLPTYLRMYVPTYVRIYLYLYLFLYLFLCL